MVAIGQKEKAAQFRDLHRGPNILVLPNAWDAASACIFEQAGFRAIGTTSSGVAASLGYADGQRISRKMMLDNLETIVRAVKCPVSADSEGGYGDTIEEVVQTISEVIRTGAVGINIEDSTKGQEKALVDVAYQIELIKAIRELATAMDVPLVINARTDVFLMPTGDATSRFEQAVERANAYREAGADCLFLIGVNDAQTIAGLVRKIHGPINILADGHTPAIPELARLGVARVSFGSGPMRATLGYLRQIAQELLTQGTYEGMVKEMISGAELRQLFE